MRASILISTIDEGIDRAGGVLLRPQDGVEYVVLHQFRHERHRRTPPELCRPDVRVYHSPGAGLARSRNLAISHAEGAVALLADDDVTLLDGSIDLVRQLFEADPTLDVALFQIGTPPGQPAYKAYGAEEVRVQGRYPASSIEIAFRVASLRAHGIGFDERFGLGSDRLVGGEESVFISDCLGAGLHVRYFPRVVVEHPYESGGRGISRFDARRNWVVGACDARIDGTAVAIGRAVGGTLKHAAALVRHRRSPFAYLVERLSGALYIFFTNGRR